MSATIKYTYLKQQTWLYRRNCPRDLQGVLGAQALKQSLKTVDAKLAKARSAEVNAKYEEIVRKARQGIVAVHGRKATPVRVAPAVFTTTGPLIGRDKVTSRVRLYLNKRSDELRPGGFKSVRFSTGLLASLYGPRQIGSLTRDDGKTFVRLIANLAPHVGKSERTRGYGLEQLVALSRGQSETITVRTPKRIFHQVPHFLDWPVYEGHVAEAPFKSVRLDQKGSPPLSGQRGRSRLAEAVQARYLPNRGRSGPSLWNVPSLLCGQSCRSF
jgi:hypothetical protein